MITLFIMKPLKYSRHAKNRMRFHRITEAEVQSTINKPDFAEPSVESRSNAWKKINTRYLRVTFKENGDKIFVIIAVKKQKRSGCIVYSIKRGICRG